MQFLRMLVPLKWWNLPSTQVHKYLPYSIHVIFKYNLENCKIIWKQIPLSLISSGYSLRRHPGVWKHYRATWTILTIKVHHIGQSQPWPKARVSLLKIHWRHNLWGIFKKPSTHSHWLPTILRCLFSYCNVHHFHAGNPCQMKIFLIRKHTENI